MSSKRRSPDGRKELRTRSGGGSSKLRMDSRPQQPRITGVYIEIMLCLIQNLM